MRIKKTKKNMCLYPKLIRNKRYQMYNITKNDAKKCEDDRKLWVAIGCGNCIECRREKAREWQVRLNEEIKVWKYKYFVTLTFNNDELKKLCEEFPQSSHNVNLIAGKAVRRFLERYRKIYKHSLKHWLITELGHENSERIHLHGIIFSENEIKNDELADIWKYGNTYTGEYCSAKTVNYIVKYVTKIDADHKKYKADIFCSAGIGKAYYDDEFNKRKHAFKGKETIETYTLPNGTKIALPTYYRNKFWTQEERDKLWTNTLDRDRTYVRGIQINELSKNYDKYANILQSQQEINESMGYGNRNEQWNEKDYAVTFKMINTHARG